jgi:predicted phage terminase large subunit-like protein
MGRPLGAPLWPNWENLEALTIKQAAVGSRVWSALFQQSPQLANGAIFNVGAIETISEIQPLERLPVKSVRAWDLAATVPSEYRDPDWTVGVKLSSYQDGLCVVEDVIRLRANHRTVQETIMSTARLDGHSVIVSLPIDPGQAGKSQAAHLSAMLVGYRVYASREQGSKISRAMRVAAQVEAGNLAVRRALWNQAFIQELGEFPNGPKNDQIDALSRAVSTLSELADGIRRLTLPYGIR